MGIRFAASVESNAAANLKEFYVKAKDIVIIESPVGLPGRALKITLQKILKGYPPKMCCMFKAV